MNANPHDQYTELMRGIRHRLDVIQSLQSLKADDFLRAETAAFHGRKVVEGIAFACLVAVENGLKAIPKSSKGQWNAEKILKDLTKKKIQVFPNPSTIREPTEEEQKEKPIKAVISGAPENVLTREDVISIYQRLHAWLHELNPYTKAGRLEFYQEHGEQLWRDLEKLELMLATHFIAIAGEGILCVLRDGKDGGTKVISTTKVADA